MKNDSTVFVGPDVHKDSIVAAYSVGLGEIQVLGNMGVRECDMDRLCVRMQSKGARVVWVYEAGPCGYGLYRHLTKKGFECSVCVPSRLARKPGDRVKTDRRDVVMLDFVNDILDTDRRHQAQILVSDDGCIPARQQRVDIGLLKWMPELPR